ncbi:hypothetical protein EH223_02470 [candidate division KSB1 bacterium]|nr:fused MFS/spermidine synthase [candidate division KSB1 bacterium]RQW06340.1 MAG: hypothetical protein EH223_02470 [candidate division KSB1 bacterium]
MSKSHNTKKMRPMLLLVFFFSGLSALIYQIVWIRKFGLVFGVDVFAAATVLTAFMAGLALGNLVFGIIVDKYKNALKLFIFLEVGIGLFALLFPITFKALNQLYVGLSHILPLGFYATQLYRFLFAFLFLLLPTTLMGGTLPVMSKMYVTNLQTLGRRIGRLYSINNLGAFVGCFIAGFFLMRLFGLQHSIFIGAALNGLNVLLVFGMWKILPNVSSAMEEARQAAPDEVIDPLPRGVIRFVLWAFAIEGFTTLAYEVIWTRILLGFSFDKSVYFYTTVILSFIFGLSLGSILIARITDKLRNLLALFGIIEVAIGFLAILLLSGFSGIAELLNTWRLNYADSWWSSLGREYLIFFVVMLFPTTLMGMTFPIVSKICTRHLKRLGGRIGEIGFLDTVGSIFGAFVAGFILIPVLGVIKAVFFTALINILIGAIAVALQPRKSVVMKSAFIGAVVVILIVLTIFSPDTAYFQHWQTKRPGDRLLYYHEGADATIAVPQHNDGIKFLAINGSVTAFANYGDRRVHKMLGYLPYFLHQESPKKALVIGLGMGITAQSLMLPGIEGVDCLEINRGVVEAAAGYFAGENVNVMADNRLNIIIDDGRSYLTKTRVKYDIITSNAVHARLSGNLYTKEFYALCKQHLTETGIMCQWTSTNWLTPVEFASLITAFQASFPHTSLWLVNAGHLLIVGSPEPLKFPVSTFYARFDHPKIQIDLGAYMLDTPEALLAHFVTDERGLPSLVKSAPVNTDDKPIAEFSRVVSKMQIPEVVLGLIRVKHDLVERLVFDQHYLKDMTKIKEKVRQYSLAEKYYLEGVFSKNFYQEPLLALNMLTQALDLVPDDYRYHEEAASINLALAQQSGVAEDHLPIYLDNAIEHLERMLEKNPDSAFDWNNLGFVYMNRGLLDRAEDALSRAIDLAPENPLPRIYLASLYAGRGEVGAAENQLLTAIRAFPKELEAYYRLGLIYELTNRFDAAIAQYEKITKLDDSYRDAKIRLVRLENQAL